MGSKKDEKRKAKLDAKIEKGKKGNALTCNTEIEIGRFAAGALVKLMLCDAHLEIKGAAVGNLKVPHVDLDYDQINDVFFGMQNAKIATGTSPVARGIVGGAVAGQTGAMLGGMSAMNSTMMNSKKGIRALVIDYTNSEGEPASLIFNMKNAVGGKKFANDLRIACGLDKQTDNIQL